MPEESDQDKQLEEEMLRMMQEESGGSEVAEGAVGGGDAAGAVEADMLSALMQETEAPPGRGVQIAPSTGFASVEVSPNARRLQDVKLSVTIELGQSIQPISTLLEWTEGSLIELDKLAGDAVDVLVNGRPFAKGEVVTIAENFGVRITEILPKHPRLVR